MADYLNHHFSNLTNDFGNFKLTNATAYSNSTLNPTCLDVFVAGADITGPGVSLSYLRFYTDFDLGSDGTLCTNPCKRNYCGHSACYRLDYCHFRYLTVSHWNRTYRCRLCSNSTQRDRIYPAINHRMVGRNEFRTGRDRMATKGPWKDR